MSTKKKIKKAHTKIKVNQFNRKSHKMKKKKT